MNKRWIIVICNHFLLKSSRVTFVGLNRYFTSMTIILITIVTFTEGCAPLPQDFDTYWDPVYNPQSPTAGLDEAPIRPVKNYTVTVRCRDGLVFSRVKTSIIPIS